PLDRMFAEQSWFDVPQSSCLRFAESHQAIGDTTVSERLRELFKGQPVERERVAPRFSPKEESGFSMECFGVPESPNCGPPIFLRLNFHRSGPHGHESISPLTV